MGLLDFGAAQPAGGLLGDLFNDPGARIGMSLLAASSPRLRGLADVMAQQDQAKQQALQQQYIQSQIAENATQNKQREMQMAKQNELQNFIAQKFGGAADQQRFQAGQTALTAGAALGDVGPTVTNAQRQSSVVSQQPQTGFPLSFNDVVALKLKGGPDLMKEFQASQEGFKQESGNYYINPANGQLTYRPKLDNGMTMQGDTVVPASGYAQANANIKGAEAGAVEGAKYPYAVGLEQAKAKIGSANDLVTLNLPSGPLQVTRAQALAMTQPQLQPQGPQIGGGQNLTPQLRELIAQDAAANGIQNPTTNFQGAGRGQAYGVTNAPARGFGIPLQPKSAEEFSNNVAKADADQLTAWRTAAENANSALSTVENLRDAVNRGVYSGGGAQAKTAAASIINGLTGAKPKGFVGSELFNANASALVLDRIKSLGANPSNADRDFIERTIPNLDKSAEARDALINFMEQKARGSIDLYKRADTHARQNNGLAGFDQFAKPKPAQGNIIDFGSLK